MTSDDEFVHILVKKETRDLLRLIAKANGQRLWGVAEVAIKNEAKKYNFKGDYI